MKHFRPIKTFATWLLEKVRIEKGDYRGFHDVNHINHWINDTFHLTKRINGDLNFEIYDHHEIKFNGIQDVHHFYFPMVDHAHALISKFGGKHTTVPFSESIRRHEPISDQFTIDDLKFMYGDPLPNVIQYHLADMKSRLSGYFNVFTHMHHSWSRNWLPSAFIYRRDEENDGDEILEWFKEIFGDNQGRIRQGWTVSARGVYEFDDPAIAILFKLRFGETRIPQSVFLTDQDYMVLKDQLSGFKKENSKTFLDT